MVRKSLASRRLLLVGIVVGSIWAALNVAQRPIILGGDRTYDTFVFAPTLARFVKLAPSSVERLDSQVAAGRYYVVRFPRRDMVLVPTSVTHSEFDAHARAFAISRAGVHQRAVIAALAEAAVLPFLLLAAFFSLLFLPQTSRVLVTPND